MDQLYGDILALLPLLREGGQGASASALRGALTNACNPREALDGLRGALAELPEDLGPEARRLVTRIQDRVEVLWADMHG
ncbi:MAG: hypothetical protein IPL96_10735 [Holophagaceae bacterium]|nr:hypothetical protein [Holophagaceae bacterium]